tara:strand:- start:142 stop:1479 length:1338 start_codon:yes stop_codon:yes gene_type:complete
MTDSFIYAAEDLQNPKGNNNAGTTATFYQRSLYKERIYPDTFVNSLDIWYDKFLYGRIDQFQNSVTPATNNMKTIKSAVGPNINALNVVVAAFEKFSAHMAKAILANAVDRNANPDLINLRAYKSYDSPNAKYSYHTQKLFNAFYYGLTGEANFQIKDFQSYLRFYRDFLVSLASTAPVTKTSFLLSKRCDLFSTGLSIAIASEDCSDDAVKYDKFVTDPNFDFFRRCAKKFGFVLNKDAPWILTADLFTEAFEHTALNAYLTGDGGPINRDNFFDIYYEKAYLTDFDRLITILVNSYQELLRLSPTYDEEVGTVSEHCSIDAKMRKTLSVKAQQIIEGTADASVLPAKYLIDLYIDLRQAEAQSTMTSAEVKTIKKEAYEVYAVRPRKDLTALQNVADYVNIIYRNYIYDNGAIILQARNAKRLDNRVGRGRILVENDISRQLY